MIRRLFLAGNLIFAPAAALADTQQDCSQVEDLDLTLQACSEMIGRDANVAWAYNNRGFANARRGRHDRAVADFIQAIQLNADDPTAYVNLSSSYSSLGQFERAVAAASRAIELDGGDAGAYNNRAWAYFKAGTAEKGLPDALRAVELDAGRANAYDTLGHIYETLGRRMEAVASFRMALQRNPNQPESLAAMKRLGAPP